MTLTADFHTVEEGDLIYVSPLFQRNPIGAATDFEIGKTVTLDDCEGLLIDGKVEAIDGDFLVVKIDWESSRNVDSALSGRND